MAGGLGILGGTFNPPHSGHVACALCACRQLALQRVLFMPVYIPPHKPSEEDPGPRHRLAMCRLAAEGNPRLLVSTLEIDRGGPSYTIDTLRAIRASDLDAELTFILGADMALTLASWREPREVLSLARLAVAERPGTSRDEVLDALHPFDAADRVAFLDMAPIEVSSSQVRERVAAGEQIDDFVPAGVAAYIARHGLYRQRTAAPVMEAAAQ